jgi:hypothetical protein
MTSSAGSLNVMVLESESGAADEAKRELAEAGHVVLQCHDSDSPAFPCRGLVDAATCPLQSHVVDVALAVRLGVASQPLPAEDGARCALMSRVPLVVAGAAVLDPYAGFETRVLDRTCDVVAAVEEAAVAELPEHARRAEAVIATTVSAYPSEAPRVSVVRRDGGLRVHVDGLDHWTPAEQQAAIVRIAGALRAYDRSARTIDIAFGTRAS